MLDFNKISSSFGVGLSLDIFVTDVYTAQAMHIYLHIFVFAFILPRKSCVFEEMVLERLWFRTSSMI